MVPLYLAGVLMDPVEQGRLEVLEVVVSEFSAVSPLTGAQQLAQRSALSYWEVTKPAALSLLMALGRL